MYWKYNIILDYLAFDPERGGDKNREQRIQKLDYLALNSDIGGDINKESK